MANPAVFLDRDGVIVDPDFRDGRSYAPTRLEDFRLYDDARANVERLKAAGFKVFVVTNQPDVNAGKVAKETVESMHKIMMAELPIDDFRVCYHTREERCGCRKPAPGMLLELIKRHDIDAAPSYMVGDRASDVEAGASAGCRTVFIDLDYDEIKEPKPRNARFTVKSLKEAVDAILGDSGPKWS